MDANRFFSIPYDATHDFKIRSLMKAEGGIVAYGRWVALLGMLYDEHGVIDLNDALSESIVYDELEIDEPGFFETLARVGLIDSELFHTMNHVVSSGVCEQLEYQRKKSEAGKQGGRPKSNAKSTKKSNAKSTT